MPGSSCNTKGVRKGSKPRWDGTPETIQSPPESLCHPFVTALRKQEEDRDLERLRVNNGKKQECGEQLIKSLKEHKQSERNRSN